MRPSRRAVLVDLALAPLALAPLALAPLACGRPPPSPTFAAMRRGGRWLVNAQGADGLVRSQTYGLLRGGHSLTPLTLRTLLMLPPPARPEGDWLARGLAALADQQHPEGGLGSGTSDYPTYATGIWLSALAASGARGQHRQAGERAAAWLRRGQLSGPAWRGSAALGSWGMGSWQPTPPDPGHVDLSMSRRAIEGLAAWGGDRAWMVAARAFVDRCRADDGFLYSPVDPALNKAGCAERCRSYGSATADGLLALAALGAGPDDPDVERAIGRLRALHATDRNPGLHGGPMAAFAPAMRGYYRAASARAFARFGGPPGWRDALVDAVLAEQRPDGSWVNESALQKEDDPIIATCLALQALAA